MTIQISGILEIDQERGVIYFHSERTGNSALRICSLPKPIPNPLGYGASLDITHLRGCNWGNQYKCKHHGLFMADKSKCIDCIKLKN